jgi:P27 family predicted phage terminase small subunit
MAKPGPKPKPGKLKRLEGNPGRRPISKDIEPQVPDTIPTAPNHIGPVGKKEWTRISRELYGLGLLTAIDTSALAGYCAAYELWVEAHQAVVDKGAIVKTKSGNVIQNPYLSVANRQLKNMKDFLTEFGMTPSSRVALKPAAKKKTSRFEKLRRVK